VTLTHTLHLLSDNITGKVKSNDGRLAQLLKSGKTDAELMDTLMLLALTRLPKESERASFTTHLANRRAEAGGRTEAFEDLMWALLNTKEFVFNH
jgi:hypothetical protein